MNLADVAALTRQPWRALAACASRDPTWWDDFGGTSTATTEYAIAICTAICSVRQDCLDDAIAGNIRDTIRGGLTAKQRRPKKGST